jgi:hypothetical protein
MATQTDCCRRLREVGIVVTASDIRLGIVWVNKLTVIQELGQSVVDHNIWFGEKGHKTVRDSKLGRDFFAVLRSSTTPAIQHVS